MTTIATDGVSIAGDSLATSGDLVAFRSVVKIWRFKDSLYGACGLSTDLLKFKEWQKSDEDAEDTPTLSEGFSGIKLSRKGVWHFDNAFAPHKAPKLWATGSGRELALGALYAGATAHRAVSIAAKLNVNTGGPIRVLYLE